MKTRQQEWYAIVIRRHPEIVLAVDRSLVHAWTTVRATHPDIDPVHLAFITLSEKDFDGV